MNLKKEIHSYLEKKAKDYENCVDEIIDSLDNIPLHQGTADVTEIVNLREVADDLNLSKKEYDQFVNYAQKKLDEKIKKKVSSYLKKEAYSTEEFEQFADKLGEKGWHGIDANPAISLGEYRFLVNKDNMKVIYVTDWESASEPKSFALQSFSSEDLNDVIEENWFEIEKVAETSGLNSEEWLNQSYKMKLMDAIIYYGIDNIFGNLSGYDLDTIKKQVFSSQKRQAQEIEENIETYEYKDYKILIGIDVDGNWYYEVHDEDGFVQGGSARSATSILEIKEKAQNIIDELAKENEPLYGRQAQDEDPEKLEHYLYKDYKIMIGLDADGNWWWEVYDSDDHFVEGGHASSKDKAKKYGLNSAKELKNRAPTRKKRSSQKQAQDEDPEKLEHQLRTLAGLYARNSKILESLDAVRKKVKSIYDKIKERIGYTSVRDRVKRQRKKIEELAIKLDEQEKLNEDVAYYHETLKGITVSGGETEVKIKSKKQLEKILEKLIDKYDENNEVLKEFKEEAYKEVEKAKKAVFSLNVGWREKVDIDEQKFQHEDIEEMVEKVVSGSLNEASPEMVVQSSILDVIKSIWGGIKSIYNTVKDFISDLTSNQNEINSLLDKLDSSLEGVQKQSSSKSWLK